MHKGSASRRSERYRNIRPASRCRHRLTHRKGIARLRRAPIVGVALLMDSMAGPGALRAGRRAARDRGGPRRTRAARSPGPCGVLSRDWHDQGQRKKGIRSRAARARRPAPPPRDQRFRRIRRSAPKPPSPPAAAARTRARNRGERRLTVEGHRKAAESPAEGADERRLDAARRTRPRQREAVEVGLPADIQQREAEIVVARGRQDVEAAHIQEVEHGAADDEPTQRLEFARVVVERRQPVEVAVEPVLNLRRRIPLRLRHGIGVGVGDDVRIRARIRVAGDVEQIRRTDHLGGVARGVGKNTRFSSFADTIRAASRALLKSNPT